MIKGLILLLVGIGIFGILISALIYCIVYLGVTLCEDIHKRNVEECQRKRK